MASRGKIAVAYTGKRISPLNQMIGNPDAEVAQQLCIHMYLRQCYLDSTTLTCCCRFGRTISLDLQIRRSISKGVDVTREKNQIKSGDLDSGFWTSEQGGSDRHNAWIASFRQRSLALPHDLPRGRMQLKAKF